MPSIRLFFLVKEPKKLLQLRCEAQPPPSPPYHKEGLHLSPVSPSPQGRGKSRNRRNRDFSEVLVSRDDAMYRLYVF